jgi:hypothetical protein
LFQSQGRGQSGKVSKTVNSRPKRDAVETVLAMSDKVGAHSNGGVAVPPQSITPARIALDILDDRVRIMLRGRYAAQDSSAAIAAEAGELTSDVRFRRGMCCKTWKHLLTGLLRKFLIGPCSALR